MFDATRGRAVDLGYAAGWGAGEGSARAAVARRGSGAAADAATVRNGPGRAAVAQEPAPGGRAATCPSCGWTQLVGDALRSYSRYWLETFRLPTHGPARDRRGRRANTIGIEHVDAGAERGQGRRSSPCRTWATGTSPGSGWSPSTGRSRRSPNG